MNEGVKTKFWNTLSNFEHSALGDWEYGTRNKSSQLRARRALTNYKDVPLKTRMALSGVIAVQCPWG